MELLKYLARTGLDEAVMMDRFGVRVTREGDLAQFKYGPAANWAEPLTHECRGVICRETPEGWVVVARPFDKFFNLHEPHCLVHDSIEQVMDDLDLHFVEKADGSCIVMWYDSVQRDWRASTLGSITPKEVNGERFTFADLFWATAQLTPVELSDIDPAVTYIWELCTPHNQIVTQYDRPHVVLLGQRVTSTGAEPVDSQVVNLGGPPGARRFPQWDHPGPVDREGLLAWVEATSLDHQRYGKNPEGWVGYINGRPVVKLKNERYRQLHAVGGGDLHHARKQIVSALFGGTLDDVVEGLRPDLLAYSERLRESVRHMESRALAGWAALMAAGPFADRKSFALAVQQQIPQEFRPWAFQRGPDGELEFEDWLSKNHAKFGDLWEQQWHEAQPEPAVAA